MGRISMFLVPPAMSMSVELVRNHFQREVGCKVYFGVDFYNNTKLLVAYMGSSKGLERFRIFDREFLAHRANTLYLDFEISLYAPDGVEMQVYMKTEYSVDLLGTLRLYGNGVVTLNGEAITTKWAERNFAKLVMASGRRPL